MQIKKTAGDYNVVIVGSGAGGGMAGYALASAGLKVMMLEAGPFFDPAKDSLQLIAYPAKAKPEMHQGVVFFNRMRDLTASGFYTSRTGIEDLGYQGNVPGKWEGVPRDILAAYHLTGE